MEYWVHNLYSKTTNETIALNDTKFGMLISLTNGAKQAVCLLSHVPITGSVRATATPPDTNYRIPVYRNRTIFANIWTVRLWDFPTNTAIVFEYVIDTRNTNIIKSMPAPDQFISRDNEVIYYPR